MQQDLSDAAALERFRAYLRMRTDHPDPTAGYRQAVELLRGLARAGGWGFRVVELCPGHPLAVITWAGTRPELPSLVLNSHMDVVPAETEKWSVDPWAAELRGGNVYGRGTQDMKSVGAQYWEALLRLRARGFAPTRTVHLLYVPDEEVGGGRGVKLLLADPLIRALNPGLVLDEGLARADPDGAFEVFYGERKIWWLRVSATGAAGHGSRLMPGTAVPKLMRVVAAALAYRDEQVALLEGGGGGGGGACGCGRAPRLQDVTALNCTMLAAGDASRAQYNVVPTVAVAGFDVRVPVTTDLRAFQERVAAWCAQDEGVSWELVAGTHERALDHAVSAPEGYEWELFQRAAAAAGARLAEPSVFPAATDSRWIRLALDIPCFGFSPIARTPVLLHDHDEHVSVEGFLAGIGVYERMLEVLAADDAVWPHAAASAAAARAGGVAVAPE
jgi:aminoacylase